MLTPCYSVSVLPHVTLPLEGSPSSASLNKTPLASRKLAELLVDQPLIQGCDEALSPYLGSKGVVHRKARVGSILRVESFERFDCVTSRFQM